MNGAEWMFARVLKRMKPLKCARTIAGLMMDLSGSVRVANDHEGLSVQKRAEAMAFLAETCATCPKECSLAGRSLASAARRAQA